MPRVNTELWDTIMRYKDKLNSSINYLYSCNIDNWSMWDSTRDWIAFKLYFDNKDKIDSLKSLRDELNSIINTIRQNHFVLSDNDYTRLINIINNKGEYKYE